jgi:hypothetical protein
MGAYLKKPVRPDDLLTAVAGFVGHATTNAPTRVATPSFANVMIG